MLLGEREVNGRVDHDRIEVGRNEGKFNKLTIVVENSDLELISFKIVFGDRTEYDPRTSHFFKEGQRTRVIDLPPGEHVIRYIDFVYKNLPGGGRAKVAVWANKIGEAARPAESWEARGWKLLGETVVNGHGREDDDKIRVGRYEGRFSKMNIVVLDNDLEMIDLAVKFEHGEPWHPDVKAIYNADTRNRSIDFPGDERRIKWIEFRYRNIGRGKAKVQVWAK